MRISAFQKRTHAETLFKGHLAGALGSALVENSRRVQQPALVRSAQAIQARKRYL